MIYLSCTYKTETMTNILPASIELRAIELMKNGYEPLEAVKQAIINENNMISSCLNGSFLSEKGKVARDYIADRMYNTINA